LGTVQASIDTNGYLRHFGIYRPTPMPKKRFAQQPIESFFQGCEADRFKRARFTESLVHFREYAVAHEMQIATLTYCFSFLNSGQLSKRSQSSTPYHRMNMFIDCDQTYPR
jgi:hypothetical protein